MAFENPTPGVLSPPEPLKPVENLLWNRSAGKQRPARRRYRASRAFYLTILICSCWALLPLFGRPIVEPSISLQKRNEIGATLNDDEQCRQVHRAKDQCAFVHSNCPTDEGGFAAYLDLYFCRMKHTKAAAFLILISWLGLLFSTIGIAASDFFCINLSTIAAILGMSESMAGVTFLAFGNGSPDVFSTFAAMNSNSGSLAVGELFGAATFITAVVAGSMALIRPFKVARKSFVRDISFFVVAAGFSMVFLWDGKLRLWECLLMVAYYIFYVAFVVAWHWWLGRRRRRRETEAAVRGHFGQGTDELINEEEPYRDDPEDDEPRPGLLRGISREDWSALEAGGEVSGYHGREDEEEEERDRWLSELNSNMRLTRPTIRSRTNTLTPVRPSLVGALEFQAVLKSLQKSRNIQTYPLNSRRYSDDPTFTTAQLQDNMSTTSDPASRPPFGLALPADQSPTLERNNHLDVQGLVSRGRAVSANDAGSLQIRPDLNRLAVDRGRTGFETGDLIDMDDSGTQNQNAATESLQVPRSSDHGRLSSSPPSLDAGSDREASRLRKHSVSRSPDLLAVPDSRRSSRSPPRDVPSARDLPRIGIPRRQRSQSATPATSPFPDFESDEAFPEARPSSVYLSPASIGSPETLPVHQSAEQEVSRRPAAPVKWWPYSLLPPPDVVATVLFPTICSWSEKSYWERALAVIAAPSVFFLTITLPVVEGDKDVHSSRENERPAFRATEATTAGTDEHPRAERARSRSCTADEASGIGNSASVAVHAEQVHRQSYDRAPARSASGLSENPTIVIGHETRSNSKPYANNGPENDDGHSSHGLSTKPPGEDITGEPWHRWLLIVQVFLAPLFIVLAIYSQSPANMTSRWLVRPLLICLLTSLILLIPVLLVTTSEHKPSYFRPILSIVGFIVSIAWISTIASQVVGALKALAVILNMSHAIMGLTIFAVGNSLGDLVADVTVARLGYPVMALSACFGGPMLNILLGIGISGSYIIVRHANHRAHEHPHKQFKYHSYHIDVSNTLIVSGGTLLVTLVGLLVLVPLNKWVLSKRIGWGLIALWAASTGVNVVLEVMGVGDNNPHDLGVVVGT